MDNGFCLDNCLNQPVQLSDVDIQKIDWVDKTYGFNYLGVSTVIKAIGITNEEKRTLIEILCKAARDNNITLEPNVFEIMEQEYVFYGGSKETFDVIAKMKLKNIKEKVDVISKVDNMTQGEILTAMAPIDTMISICKDNCGKPLLVLNDVNMIMPFVVKAQKAAEKISRFALDHFNSRDEHKRELSKLICGRFQTMLVEMDNVTFNGYKNDTTVDWLNNNVRSVTDMLFNTIEACENLIEVLPAPKSKEKLSVEMPNFVKETKTFEEEHNSSKIAENMDAKEESVYGDDNECDDEDNGFEDEEDNDAPRIFKNKIKEDKVIEALRNLFSDKVKGKRRWYVIYRVLLFIEWLRLTNQIDFINWVKSHFGWNGVKEFRGVQSEFTHSDPNKWDLIIVKGKMGKSDNEELGPDYYDFAVAVRDALVDVNEVTGEMQDKDEFRVNPHQGVLHNSKWK